MSTLFKLSQLANASNSIEVTELGILILGKALQE